MNYRLGVLRGDGIGPEIVAATLEVLEAARQRDRRLGFEWVPLPMGWEAIRATGSALPESAVEALGKCDAWILGPHDSVSYPPALREKLNPSGALRRRFDLYANIRPARAYPGLPAVCPRMDLVIARENTEGFYADRNMYWGIGEFMPTPDVALAVGKVTRQASERIAIIPAAFEEKDLLKVLSDFDTVVLMKVSRVFDGIYALLKELGLEKKCAFISRVGTAEEEVVFDLESLLGRKLDYLSMLIVKK